jgi:hypothetical protein
LSGFHSRSTMFDKGRESACAREGELEKGEGAGREMQAEKEPREK